MTLVSRAAAVLLATALLAAAVLAQGQPPPALDVPAAVRAAVAQGRSVHVIVRVRGAFRAEGQLDRPAALAQRAQLRARVQQVLGRMPARLGARARRFQLIPAFAAEVDAGTLSQLEADPNVEGIEEDRLVPPLLQNSGPLIGAPGAWAAGISGLGWNVAVLDTGVQATHPFLASKVVSEACYSNAGGAGSGASLCPGGASSSTASGSGLNCALSGCDHGTHVAGIAAGRGSTFSGIARDAQLISMQVYTRFDTVADCGATTAIPCLLSYTSDEILALERVFALKDTYNIAAVNLSLGSGRYFSSADCDAHNVSIKASIDHLRSVGIATVVAAGNSGFVDSLTSPACISSAVSVGSSTKADAISSFSNTASFLSLLAPGSAITSSVPGGVFGEKSGTSMATPHVAGAFALLKQRRPGASVSQILSALQTTGVMLIDPTGRALPRIQVDAAAAALQSTTQMSLDTPANGVTLTQPFIVAGWALDPSASSGTGVDAVHVYAYPASGAPIFLGAAAYGGARADVGALFGVRFANSGFGLNAQGLAAGTYQLVVYAHSTVSGAFDATRVVSITVGGQVSDPQSVIDTPAAGASVGPSFLVGGWAIDRASSGPGVDAVHVYAYPNPGSGAAPILLGVATYGSPRGDIGAYFGAPFVNSGYGLVASGLPSGVYRIVVFSRSTVSGQFDARTRDITVRTLGDPTMAIDLPAAGASVTGPFRVAGWAIDRDSTSGPGVDAIHVYAYPATGAPPIFLGSASYGFARPDVANIFGARFANSGFNLVAAPLAPGAYDVVVYPHSAVSGTFAGARVVRVNVH